LLISRSSPSNGYIRYNIVVNRAPRSIFRSGSLHLTMLIFYRPNKVHRI
jgi:hypothetical protein